MLKLALAISLSAALAGCHAPTSPKQEKINPLTAAESYMAEHFPDRVPKGLERAWYVEDHGDVWTVEMFEQGMFGGGTKMVVNKRDGHVELAGFTQ